MPPKPGDNKGKPVTTDDKIDGLTKAFGDMTKMLNGLPGQIGASVTGGIQSLARQERDAQTKKAKDAEDDDDDETPMPSGNDLEKLTRTEFANHMMGQLGKVLDKKLKPFQDSLSTNIEAGQREKVGTKFEAARKAHPDFDKWKDEMGELVQSRGYLDPEELYILVRANNPDKTKELDQEATKHEEAVKQKKQEDDKEAKGRDAEKPKFLGLLPTSGGKPADGEPQHKTAKEAAAAAYDEVMGGIPESLIGEQSQT